MATLFHGLLRSNHRTILAETTRAKGMGMRNFIARFGLLVSMAMLVASCGTTATAPQSTTSAKRPPFLETFIPDLMQIDWIRAERTRTVIQFRFLRGYCSAVLREPGHSNAFRIVDVRHSDGPPLMVKASEGVFSKWGPQECGQRGDKFRLTFDALPSDVTAVNVLEGAGGRKGLWSWYDIPVER